MVVKTALKGTSRARSASSASAATNSSRATLESELLELCSNDDEAFTKDGTDTAAGSESTPSVAMGSHRGEGFIPNDTTAEAPADAQPGAEAPVTMSVLSNQLEIFQSAILAQCAVNNTQLATTMSAATAQMVQNMAQ
eukprot:8009355-Karenia_brevis.AAC.1